MSAALQTLRAAVHAHRQACSRNHSTRTEELAAGRAADEAFRAVLAQEDVRTALTVLIESIKTVVAGPHDPEAAELRRILHAVVDTLPDGAASARVCAEESRIGGRRCVRPAGHQSAHQDEDGVGWDRK